MDNLTETKLTSEKIYSGCILDFYRDTVRLPNGGTAPRELSRHVGAVCIVPLLDDGRVIVERQFRYPVNEVITEIPAYKRDSRDEAPGGRRAPRAARGDRHHGARAHPARPVLPRRRVLGRGHLDVPRPRPDLRRAAARRR